MKVAAAVAAAIVALVAALPAALLAAGGTPHRVGSAGVTVRLPSGWRSAPAPTLPQTDEPVQRLAVASGPLRLAAGGCGLARYAVAPRHVEVVVLEWRARTAGARPRPARFTTSTLPVRQPPAIECWSGPGGATEFTARGHWFEVAILAGRRAAPALVAQARAVLDTLRVTRS